LKLAGARRVPPWALAVFSLALASRLTFWLLSGQPLLYRHQYHYFQNGLSIALHPHPFAYALGSDEWRTWVGWTIAPLYYLFEGAIFLLFGPHLGALRFAQCVLGALSAVAVASLGRSVAGQRGAWAGVAYAVYAYTVELPCWTLTENLNLPLTLGGMAMAVASLEGPGWRAPAMGGALLGLSSLARSVTSAFVPVLAAWRWWYSPERPRAWRAPILIVACAAAMIVPWVVRTSLLTGRLSPVETAVYENIWFFNNFVGARAAQEQLDVINRQPTLEQRQEKALRFARKGIDRNPWRIVEKSVSNFWHFLRPEGLHNLLLKERSIEPWRHAFTIVLEDAFLALLIPPLLVFVLAGRPSPARSLILFWLAYYLFMVIVVFGNEVPRYRTLFVPFALAGAAGGLSVLGDPDLRLRLRTGLGVLVGVWLIGTLHAPYAGAALRAYEARAAIGPALDEVDRGNLALANELATRAADEAPLSPRPWLTYARRLRDAGHPAEAVAAYQRADKRAERYGENWIARAALPRLLRETGDGAGADAALKEAQILSWNADPWLVLEAAWRELPPPRTNEIRVGEDDYGTVRGFYHPQPAPQVGLAWARYGGDGPSPSPGPHRWTRAHAWLRLVPLEAASSLLVTLEMGSPFPSPLESPQVAVALQDGPPQRVTLGREVRPHEFKTALRPGETLLVRIDSPTWNRPGEPAEQGVRVERLSVRAAP
jgi:hypothetical protein